MVTINTKESGSAVDYTFKVLVRFVPFRWSLFVTCANATVIHPPLSPNDNTAIKMLFRVACLFLAIALVSGLESLEDTFKAMKIKAYLPDDPKNKHDQLVVKCIFDPTKADMQSLSKIRLFTSEDGDSYEPLGAVSTDKKSYGLKKTEIKVKGSIKSANLKSKLVIKYRVPDLGYCRYYKCVASGRDITNNKLKEVYEVIEVGSEDGTSCE
ncbi:hypothetical protein PoB_002031700 [Plakobranchus ocellatus]|uniref:Uncharacterized protein n=1 Tax=Plakobranchus ocellatus TaxID=259542 RepID=A0AAV3ZEU0_9GAST|nr:hypothetical protein PoB_002031700 [Plakobranchus ocellatus]